MDWNNFSSKHWKHMQKTHYETLGVKEDCAQKEIRHAYLTLSKLCHPDRNPDDKRLHNQFLKIQEAYEVLREPAGRRMYDENLSYYRSTPKIPRDNPRYYDSNLKYTYNPRGRPDPFGRPGYYGRTNIRKVSNGAFAGILVIGVCITTFLQYQLLKWNTKRSSDFMKWQNQRLSREWNLRNSPIMGNPNDPEVLRVHDITYQPTDP